jgi:hypothetical protein
VVGALSYVTAGYRLILASSGGLVQMILAATAAGGVIASIGEVPDWLIGRRRADRDAEQLRCGSIPLWVQLDSNREARVAIWILRRHGAEDVHLPAPCRLAPPRAAGEQA